MLIGFDIADVKTEKDMDAAVEGLENEVLMVSEVRRRRAQKIRKVESVVRICLKKCVLRKWKNSMTTLTKMLSTIEDIKADVSDVVSGFNW